MSRLIDADKFKERIREEFGESNIIFHNLMVSEIDDEETAYDVDKVIEKLEAERQVWKDMGIVPVINLDKAIRIVKEGAE